MHNFMQPSLFDILKNAGIDITSEEPYEKAFKYFEEKLKFLEEE